MAKVLEVFLVLSSVAGPASQSDQALQDLRQHYRVIAAAPPRLAVVEVDESRLSDLRLVRGVAEVVQGDLPASLIASFSPNERIFAQAWQFRKGQRKPLRAGDGLPWDAPGFTPPDAPRR